MTTLTKEIILELISKIRPLPPIPVIWYSKHIGKEDSYEFDNSQLLSYLLFPLYHNDPSKKILIVGKDIAIKLINQGIEIQNKEVVMAEYEEIDLEVVFMTDDAILLTDSEIEGWIPKSCIQNIDELPKWLDKGDTHTFEIATYQLKDKGFI